MKQGEGQKAGIACPQCGCRHFYTTHTEPLRDGRIRRRKVCRHCGRKLLTFESTTAKAPDGFVQQARHAATGDADID